MNHADISAGGSIEKGPLHLHGVLAEVFGTGVLILGEPGIGKTETALELVRRGHKLVADDAVTLTAEGENLLGFAPELTYGFLEISGLGILNIREVFGADSVLQRTNVQLWVELVTHDTNGVRSGTALAERSFLGRQIRGFTLAVGARRDAATLIETAVLIFKADPTLERAGMDLAAKHKALLAVP